MQHYLKSSRLNYFLLFILLVVLWSEGGFADEIRHSFLGVGVANKVAIISENGEVEWSIDLPASDGWVEPNGDVLLALYRTEGFPQGGVVLVDRKTKELLFRYQGGQKETSTVQRLPNGNFAVTELGDEPRIVEIDPKGSIVQKTALHCQKENVHMQTRMSRVLSNGNFLVPHLLDFSVKEYAPGTGVVVASFATDGRGREKRDWPFTAIRLESGNTLIGCTNGNRVIEIDSSGKVVWSISNDDLPEAVIQDACGVQRLENGNTVLSSYHASGTQPKLIEVTPEKKVVWKYGGHEAGFHHFQILSTNGKALVKNGWR